MIPALVVAAVILVVVIIVLARRREPDTLHEFRRQIDALSPEARRPVVDQVQRLEESETRQPEDATADDVSPEESGSDPGPDAEDDRGT